jgi:hypothetical protein
MAENKTLMELDVTLRCGKEYRSEVKGRYYLRTGFVMRFPDKWG